MERTLARLLQLARNEGRELFIVGGFIRDALLGRHSRDVDIAVDYDALQFAKRISWLMRGDYELLDSQAQYSRVTLKAEDGKLLFLDFSLRRGQNIKKDLLCRDFTVNALAVSLEDFLSPGGWRHKVIDPAGGINDLARGLLRIIKEKNLREDPVRILRCARFAIKLGLDLEPSSREAIRRNSRLLGSAPKMKLAIEAFQLLEMKNAVKGLRILHELHALGALYPPFAAMDESLQSGVSLLKHCLFALEMLEELFNDPTILGEELSGCVIFHTGKPLCERRSRLAYLKIACLCHDIGKLDLPGYNTPMFSHEQAGEKYVTRLASRLKLNDTELCFITRLVLNHSRPVYLGKNRMADLRFLKQFQDMVPELLLLSAANLYARGGNPVILKDMLAEYFRGSGKNLPDPLLGATQVMDFFGLAPTRSVGLLLEELYAAQLQGQIRSSQEALSLASVILERELAGRK